MIYEYPEDFVVPVVYTKDLNPVYREWEFKYVDESIVPFDQSEEDKTFYINKNERLKESYFYSFNSYENADNKKTYCDNLIYDELDEENTKYILNDIDDDYAYSETLRI